MSFVDMPIPTRLRISSLFQDNLFIVPQYQRNFAWQDPEIDDFWNDLSELADGNRNSHFFGQIVTFRNPDGVQELIDGQQRLTSSSILLAAMRDVADRVYTEHREELSPDSGDTLRDVMRDVSKYLRGEDSQPSLILQKGNKDKNGVDANAFFEHLIHGKFKKAYTEPTKNMRAAYSYFHRKITEMMKLKATWAERVDRLSATFHAFVDNFYVVMISAPTQRDAFIIFETLNSRGKDLAASDIIKNHLMYLSNGDVDRANQKWNEVSHVLKDDSKRITRFIRTYWAARQRLVVESHLYRALSQELTNGAKSNEFLDDLLGLAPLYSILESGSLAQRTRYFANPELARQIDVLSKLQVKLFYPVLLALSKRGFSERDMVIVTQKVISVFVRHRTIMNDGTNRLETGFATIAADIWSGKLSTTMTISQALDKSLKKPDAQVKGAFLNLAKEGGQIGQKKWTLVYLLTALYDEELEDAAFNDDDFQPVHVDEAHIGPMLVNNIGNWTLLEKALIKPYEEAFGDPTAQAALLKRSKIKANRSLASKILTWDDKAMASRQRRFAAQSVVIW